MKKLILGIGAPRCGTTWAYKNLRNSTNIYLPPVKELRFFTNTRSKQGKIKQALQILDSKRYSETDKEFARKWLKITDGDVSNYLSLFPDRDICCEISPIYCTLNSDQVKKIRETVESVDCSIFLYLRNPFFRDLSHIIFSLHRQKNVTTEYSDDYYLKYVNTEGFQARSNYSMTISNWRASFGDNLNMFYYDELQERPKKFFRKFCRALDIEFDKASVTGMKVNKSGSENRYKVNLPQVVYDVLSERSFSFLDNTTVLSTDIKDKWSSDITKFLNDQK